MTARWLFSASKLRAGLPVFFCIPALASCGSNSHPDATAMSSSAITQATFTLTAPKGMSVLTPAVESANSLAFGSFAKVMPTAPVVAMGTSGTTTAEPDIQLNDVWSRGPVTLKDRDKILGVLHAKTLSPANFPLTQPQDKAPVFDPVSKLTWTVTYPTTTPVNVNVDPPNKVSIDPGVYGSIALNPVRLGGQGAELTLKSGTYYVGTLTLDSYSKVWLDQSKGPVIIYVSTVNAFRGTFASLDGTPPDLFVGYFGTNPIYIETQYNGAIVAQNALMTLRTVSGGHTGFFAGKNVTLDSNAIVNYRVPNLISTVAKVPQSQCKDLVQKRTDLTGDAQQAAYIADLARYCGICNSTIDTDKDKTADCVDGCPYDPAKTAPGIAGCGKVDQPKIPGGFPPGLTQCASDPNNVMPGDCGCIGEGNLQPSGTRCYDPDCPGQTNPVCDGQGQCGTRTCVPTGCRPITIRGTTFFVCGGTAIPPGTTGPTKTQQGAYDACNAKGLTMARVDTYAQNQQIRDLLKSLGITQAWLGGNQITTAGAWRWAKLGSFAGDQFWSGAATGTPVNGRFTFWSLNNPGTAKCLAMQASDGRWTATDCTQTLPYVCENQPTVSTTPGGGGGTGTGNPPIPRTPAALSSCVPNSASPAPLPENTDAGMAQLMNEYALADAGTFTGSASAPPAATSTCPSAELTRNCPLKNIKLLSCDNPSTPEAECDCATENARRKIGDPDICAEQFGSTYVCLASKDDPTCNTNDPSILECHATAHCGVPDCSNEKPKFTRCDQINLCPNPADEYIFQDLDDGNTILPEAIGPGKFIHGTPVTAQSPAYDKDTPPAGPPAGKGHIWCQLNTQDPANIAPADSTTSKDGKSGGSSPINVKFNPKLVFDADVNPLAFGQSNLHLNAQAFMSATVDMPPSLLVPPGAHQEIFHAGIEVTANRCQVQASSDFAVLGQTIDLGKWIPQIDTDDASKVGAELPKVGALCKNAVDDFILKADRLKKAFRDAQQLLYQYKTYKDSGKAFGTTLCQDLGILDLASKNFPLAGMCPENEPPELTINRFIEFYQNDRNGEYAQLTGAVSNLYTQTQALIKALQTKLNKSTGAELTINFANFKSSQSHTIIKTPFAIGPVPMLLEVAVVTGYGLNGRFDLTLNFPVDIVNPIGNLDTNNASPDLVQIARAGATVEPWASAGMTMFVGANFGIGSVGIEGGLTLAKISAPIVAGVGLSVASVEDKRTIPTDIASVSSQTDSKPNLLFGTPKAYQFYLTYDFGASVNLTDVLSGEVNGRLTIDFWFFSRTWRKRIVKFTGWSKQFPLISTSGTFAPVTIPGSPVSLNTANAAAALGRAESPLPFTFLEPLQAETADPSGVEVAYNTGAGGASGSGGSGGSAGAAGSGPTIVPVDKTLVEAFSYDTLCCQRETQDCNPHGRNTCCAPLDCVLESDGVNRCQKKALPSCAAEGATCGFDSASGTMVGCCSGLPCGKNNKCPPVPVCKADWDWCTPGVDTCCSGAPCVNGPYGHFCDPTPACQPELGPCTTANDCCDPPAPKWVVCSTSNQCIYLEIQ